MIMNLSNIVTDYYGNYEQPYLMIATMGEDPICPVINPLSLESGFVFNDVSELTFSVADKIMVNNEWIDNPCFDELVGMRKIIMEPFGVFVIVNPQISDDGEKRIKEVTCYSGEYELNFKTLPAIAGTLRLYDPTGLEKDTMMNIILECCPTWKLGTVAPGLSSRYRTFDMSSQSVYSFLMGDFQTSYGVVVLFDTFNKEINIYDAQADVETVEVYLDRYNLISDNQINELSDEIVTCLSVYGADDVSVASVNPLGAKLYNLDYIIQMGDLPDDLVEAWRSWQTKYEVYQQLFSDLYSKFYNDQLKYNTNYTKLVDLKGELSTLEHKLDTYVTDVGGDHADEIATTNTEINIKTSEVTAQQAIVDDLYAQLELDQSNMQEIKKLCSLEHNFTEDQILLINLYLKEDSLQDNSYVLSNVIDQPTLLDVPTAEASYTLSITAGDLYRSDEYAELTEDEWEALDLSSTEKAELQKITSGLSDTYLNHKFYHINSGICDISNVDDSFNICGSLTTSTVSYADEVNEDGTYDAMITMSFSSPAVNGDEITYTNALFVASCKIKDFTYTSNMGTVGDDTMSMTIVSGVLTLTCDSSIDMRQNTLQDLYEYGQSVLESLAYPSYEFQLDVANLFGIEDFEYFRRNISLGKKCFVELKPDYYLRPILIGVDVDWMDITKLSLIFSSKFSANNPEFLLAETIGKTAQTTASLDSSKFSYSAYINSGIQNDVEKLINGALDVSKNNIINSSNQDIIIDSQGIHIKKYNSLTGMYDTGEVRMTNGQIVFTDDNWQTAGLAIGKIETPDGASSMGIVGQSIIGEVIIGNKLLIEATNYDANFATDVTHFRVDAGGVKMANGAIYIQGSDPHNQIIIDPMLGIMAGDNTLFKMSDSQFELDIYDEFGNIKYDPDVYNKYKLEIPAGAKFYFDINTGNLVFRGDVYAENGYFNGVVNATDGVFNGTVYATDGEFNGIVYATDGVFEGTVYAYDGFFYGDITADNLTIAENATVKGLSADYITTGTLDANNIVIGGWIWDSISATQKQRILGVNNTGENGNLQLGTPTNPNYKNLTVYAPGNIYFMPGESNMDANDYVMRIAESAVEVNGELRVGGSSVVTTDDMGNFIETGDAASLSSLRITGLASSVSVNSYRMMVAGSTGNVYASNITYGDVLSALSAGGSSDEEESSMRFKHNIQPLSERTTHGIDKLYDVEVKSWIYNDDYLSKDSDIRGVEIYGLIAEDLEGILPGLVIYEQDGTVRNYRDRLLLNAMLKLIQDQKKEINKLRSDVDVLLEKRS